MEELTDDEIYEICSGLSDQDIVKISSQADKFRTICHEVLNQRIEEKKKKEEERKRELTEIRGVIKDDIFRLITPTTGPRLGKRCSSFSVEELLEIAKIIRLEVPSSLKLNSKNLCKIIKKYLNSIGKVTLLSQTEKPMRFSNCVETEDLMSLVGWDESPPDTKIKFITTEGNKSIHCYKFESLRKWILNPSNTFALWVEKPGTVMDSEGHGGKPDLNVLFVKLYTGEFVHRDKLMNIFLPMNKYKVLLEAVQTGYVRIGNLQGKFGVGMLHGQSSYRVYDVRDLRKKTTQTQIQKTQIQKTQTQNIP